MTRQACRFLLCTLLIPAVFAALVVVGCGGGDGAQDALDDDANVSVPDPGVDADVAVPFKEFWTSVRRNEVTMEFVEQGIAGARKP